MKRSDKPQTQRPVRPSRTKPPSPSAGYTADHSCTNGLTKQEQEAVRRHLGLVAGAFERYRRRCSSPHTEDEKLDLCQEGFLALISAVRSHIPEQHGDLSTYALARIRYAMSRFDREERPLIRVPFITQRRCRRPRDRPTSEHVRLPRVFSLSEDDQPIAGGTPCGESTPGSQSIAELIRHRYDAAVDRVVRDMLAERRRGERARSVIRRCRTERWSIPEPAARTSIRRLAKELDCSVGCITHCESRFRAKLAWALRSDTPYRWLRRTARRHPRGWKHTLTDVEVNKLMRSRRKRRHRTRRRSRRLTPTGYPRSRERCLWQQHSRP